MLAVSERVFFVCFNVCVFDHEVCKDVRKQKMHRKNDDMGRGKGGCNEGNQGANEV